MRPNGFLLRVGADAVAVEDAPKAKFWARRAASTRTAFSAGDEVWVRIKTNVSPALLREMCDGASKAWLEDLRKNVKQATVKKTDERYVTFAFGDGTQLAYRATAKSKIRFGGADRQLSDLKEGQSLYVKGRTLSTLDTWLVWADDRPPKPAPPKPAKKSGKPPRGAPKDARPKKLPMVGRIEVQVQAHIAEYRMIDVRYEGVLLHVTYTATTKFRAQGKRVGPDALVPGMRIRVSYRRDQLGRILASQVDLIG